MKDKRNCGNGNYPIYSQPVMVPPMGYPLGFQTPLTNYNQMQGINTNTLEQQLNNIEQQINLLDQRVTRLEKMNNNSTNNYNNYNDSNYYMV